MNRALEGGSLKLKKLWQQTALSILISGIMVALVVLAVASYTVYRSEKVSTEQMMGLETRIMAQDLEKVLQDAKTQVKLAAGTAQNTVVASSWTHMPEMQDYFCLKMEEGFRSLVKETSWTQSLYFYFNAPYVDVKNATGAKISPNQEGKWEITVDDTHNIGEQGFSSDNSKYDWYFGTLQTGQGKWIEPEVIDVNGKSSYIIRYVTPVFSTLKKESYNKAESENINEEIMLGVAGGEFKCSVFNDYLNSMGKDDGTFGFILSPEGDIIGHLALDTENGTIEKEKTLQIETFLNSGSNDLEVGDYFVATKKTSDDFTVGYAVPKSVVMAPLWSTILHIITGSLIALLVAAGLGMTMGKRLARPIVDVSGVAEKMGEGDFREVSLNSNSSEEVSKLQNAISRTVENLGSMIRQVGSLSEQLAASSEEVAAGADESGRGAENSMVQVQKVVDALSEQIKALEELSLFINQGGEQVENCQNLMNQLGERHDGQLEATEEGARLARQSENTFKSLEEISRGVNESFSQVTESMDKIIGMADTISSIADQTNLLALNAAIEAARAGDAGRGFAVVAEEVRKLAEESAKAADQIHGYIGEIQPRVKKAEESLSEAGKATTEGADVIEKTGEAFNAIQNAARTAKKEGGQAADVLSNLASTYSEIEEKLGEVNRGREVVSDSTQQLSASSEEQSAQAQEFAASSQTLSEMAEKLTAEIAKFQTE